jgi:hypothetical protein
MLHRHMASAELGSLLTACVRASAPDDLAAADAARLRRIDAAAFAAHCERHGVGPCVHRVLRSRRDVPPALEARLEEQYFASAATHVRCIQDLAIAADALDRAQVPWLAFKGPVLAETVYSRPDLRAYADLDLLVAPAAMATATNALEAAGGEVLDRNWERARQRMSGEIHVGMPTGTVVDLHWHVLNETRVRSAFTVDTDELIRRSRRVAVAGIDVPTFDPIDTLVHVALHACMAGANRLLWCKDLEQIVASDPVDWASVTQRARTIGAGPPVAVMLMVASRALDFDVPRGAVRKLSPGPVWRHVARVADAQAPVERWSGRGSLARDVARTTRRDDRTSVNALTRRYASVVRRGRRATPHDTNRDPRHRDSVLFPAGDARDRDAYFAAVERDAIDDRL